MVKLTVKQEGFINDVVSGMNYTEAFKNNYNTKKWKEKTINETASRMFKNHKVNARYEELIKKHQDKAIMTREMLLEGYKKAFEMAMGVKPTRTLIRDIIDEVEEIVLNRETLKVDLKAIALIGEKISKLEGWDKTNDNNDDSIMALANAISGLK